MKDKCTFIIFCILVVGATWFAMSNHKIRKSETASATRTIQKCPDDFANDDAGEAEYLATMDKWTNDFYDLHPSASLGDWERARHQFWIDNHCTAALQRYQDAETGKANHATMEQIRGIVQEAIKNFNQKN